MATRRWYYFVPANGAPRGLVHAIERHNLDELPGDKRVYAGREQLAAGLQELLKGAGRVAMEYSPGNAIPYVSRVDAGTDRNRAAVRRDRRVVGRSGAAVRGDLDRRGAGDAPRRRRATLPHQGSGVRLDSSAHGRRGRRSRKSRSRTRWSGGSARRASSPIRPRTCRRRRMRATRTTRPPRPCIGRFAPTRACSSTSGVSCRCRGRCSRTSPGWASPARTFLRSSRRPSRRRATDVTRPSISCSRRCAAGRELRGFEVDRACRAVIERAGFGAQFIHRTGPQPGRERARQRRPHGRLRDARRPPAAARHGVHD